jgi:segregation and condensation protein A
MAGMSEQQLVNHLLFHKALIAEDGDNERVNDYIRLVKERGQGHHVGIEDPFDRSISLAFELVLDQGMDPWAIDLVSFTGLYMSRVRDGAQIDLITAGKLLHMAWSILRLQSEKLRLSAEPPVVIEPEPSDPWAEIDATWAEDDPDRAYNERILQGTEDVLDEKVRHKGDRKVTLMELVEALEEARREADLRATIVEKREAEKAHRSALRRGRAEGAAHKEDPESDIREVWERILGQNGVPIPITSIQERTKDDMVRTLVSILFLARENKIRIWQENFPYGMIYVQNPGAKHPGAAEPAGFGQNPNAAPHKAVEMKHVQN